MRDWSRFIVGAICACLAALQCTPSTAGNNRWTMVTSSGDQHICLMTSSSGLQFELDGKKLNIVFAQLPNRYWYDDTIDVFYTHIYPANLTIGADHFHLDMAVVDYGVAADFGLKGDDTIVSLLAPVEDPELLRLLKVGTLLTVSIGKASIPLQYSLAGSAAAIDEVNACAPTAS